MVDRPWGPPLILHLENSRIPPLGWTGLHHLEPKGDFVLPDMDMPLTCVA